MAIAAGPRIINSTMGPIPLAEATSGVVSISVTFDRAINSAARSGPAMSRSSTTTPTTADGYVPLHVIGRHSGRVHRPRVGNTQFTITFNPTPAGANPATYNYTGTYSYLIAPDNGPAARPSARRSGRLSTAYSGNSTRWTRTPTATSDENALTTPFTGQTPGDVYAVPTPQPTTGPIRRFFGAASILSRVRFNPEHPAPDRAGPAGSCARRCRAATVPTAT